MTTNDATLWSDTSMKWPAMTAAQKAAFIGKLIIALCTFGFAFPNVMD
jgi:hypothetical protein